MPRTSGDERALLAAIIAAPDDDTLRLAYADWLDEHADDLPKPRRKLAKVRAELIRIQIEEAGLIFRAPDFDERYEAVQKRERDLMGWDSVWSRGKGAYDAMVEELEGYAPARGVRFTFRRGLFGLVECNVKYFIEHGEPLLAAAPITCVELKKLAASNVKKLAECPHFVRVPALKFCAVDTPLDAAFALLDRAPLGHLRRLRFDNWIANYGDTSNADPLAVRLASCEKLRGLKKLSLYAAGVGVAGGRALAASSHLKDLEVLDLRTNSQLGASKAALRKRFGNRVWFDYDDMKGLPLGYQDRD